VPVSVVSVRLNELAKTTVTWENNDLWNSFIDHFFIVFEWEGCGFGYATTEASVEVETVQKPLTELKRKTRSSRSTRTTMLRYGQQELKSLKIRGAKDT
jgi:hypothetical protein